MDERIRRLGRNAAGMVAGKGTGLLVSLAAVPLVVGALGPAGFGMWAVCQMLVTWAQALDLGLGLGLQNEISHAADAAARQRAARAAGALRATMLAAACLVGSAGLGCAWLWPGALRVFGPDGADHAELGRALLTLTAAAMALALLAQTALRTTAGLELTGRTSLAQAVGSVAGLALLIAAAATGHPLPGIAALMLLPTVAQFAAAQVLVRRPEHAWARPTQTWNASDWKRLMAAGVWFLCSQAATVIVFQTDAVIVSIFLGVVEAGTYQATARIFAIIVLAQGVLLAALWPAIARAHGAGDLTWIVATYRRALLPLAFLVPFLAGLALLTPWLVGVWTGSEALRPSPWLAAGCAVGCAATLWANLHATCLNAVGCLRIPAFLALAQAALNLVAVLVAVHWCGGAGVAWASAGCALVTSVPGLWLVWRQQRRLLA